MALPIGLKKEPTHSIRLYRNKNWR